MRQMIKIRSQLSISGPSKRTVSVLCPPPITSPLSRGSPNFSFESPQIFQTGHFIQSAWLRSINPCQWLWSISLPNGDIPSPSSACSLFPRLPSIGPPNLSGPWKKPSFSSRTASHSAEFLAFVRPVPHLANSTESRWKIQF